jgi:hypothetical protein
VITAILSKRHFSLPFRMRISRFAFCFFIGATALHAADNKALPVTMPVAAPAFVDVVSFEFRTDGENHKVSVTTAPNLLRVDEPSEGYSIIYDPQTEHYTGLEHRNYTYWEFSWPEVSSAVQNSKQHEARLQELSSEGLFSDNPSPTTNAAPDNSAITSSAGDDGSGYVWQPTTDKQRIADLDCVRWTGSTASGETVDAWCYASPLPKVQEAIRQLRTVDEPIALVPVRMLAPDFIFPVYTALLKGGVTPVLITWGDDQNKNSFRLVKTETRDGKASLFSVPKLYMKTTLITMDGLFDKQPISAPRKSTEAPKKTWQN